MSGKVGVRRHVRRRIRSSEVRFFPESRKKEWAGGFDPSLRLGGLTESGEIHVFLGSHVESLRRQAVARGIELKEAHVRDDIIETVVHESMHRALKRIDAPLGKQTEEWIVDKLTEEVMHDIREEADIRRLK